MNGTTIAERLCDLPPLDVAGLLTTPVAEAPFAIYRERLDTILAVPLLGQDGVLIAVVAGEAGSMHVLALRSHFEDRSLPVRIQACSPQILSLLLTQWRASQDVAQGARDNRTELERHFEMILADAIRMNASDIHIERSHGHAAVKLRANGILQPYADWPADYADSMAQMLYAVEADADGKDTTYDPKVPQDGRIGRTVRVDGEPREVSIRFASMPVRGGNDVTLRVLPEGRSRDEAYIPLERLGYEPSQIDLIEKMTAQPVGAVMLAGVTGSGKSTTLKSLLMWLDRLHRHESKLRSIEDPPEYSIPGVRQSPVVRSNQREAGSPFATMIRAAMRGDPDVIMIGEVRDPDTVELLIGATLSGHKVFATIHAVSANTVPARLFTINAKSPVNIREIISSGDFLAGAIYQKLLPVLCLACARGVDSWERIADQGLRLRLRAIPGIERDRIRLRGTGCPECRGGIKGRTICAETLLPDFELIRLYGQGLDYEALRHWRSKFRAAADGEPYRALGGFALDHGVHKMRQGLLDPRDVELQLGTLDRFDALETADGVPATESPSNRGRQRRRVARVGNP